MPKPDIFMPFYISDYVMDTLHLTLEEDCLYRRLLDVYWLTEAKGLPNNDEDLARQTRIDLSTFQRLKPRVISFFTLTAGLLRNAKAETVYLDSLARMETASEKGKRGAQLRWKDKTPPDAQAMPGHMPGHMLKQCSSICSSIARALLPRVRVRVRINPNTKRVPG